MSNQGLWSDWVTQAGGMKPAAGNEGAQREGGGNEGVSVVSPRDRLPTAGDDALCALIDTTYSQRFCLASSSIRVFADCRSCAVSTQISSASPFLKIS